ncbi:MAG: YicC family protein [Proteobacteria bacterium]|nr:YicC family protein [Pseudomonadota bacterium]
MPISSMTGFARAEGHEDDFSWTWEVKSVNGKGLDVRCRLPAGLEGVEQPARARIAKRFRRGNISLALTVRWNQVRGSYRVNRAVLDDILSLLPEIRERFPDAGPPHVEGLLALRGVIEPVEDEPSEEARQAAETALLAGLDEALESLASMRDQEGARLASVLTTHLDGIGRLCAEAEGLAAAQPDAIKERLRIQVAALLDAVPALPEERLAQEAALLMAKADVREELDRLKAHRDAARDLMGGDGAIGRKLDFLCQEFNREANTLCSKSVDLALTRVGIELKAGVEQLREQVQNIE